MTGELGKVPVCNPGGNNNPEGLGGKSEKMKDCQRHIVTLTKKDTHNRGNAKDYTIRRLAKENRHDLIERIAPHSEHQVYSIRTVSKIS